MIRILNFFRNFLCLLKFPFLVSFSENFSTVCIHTPSKFCKKPAHKWLIFSSKGSFERSLFLYTFLLGSSFLHAEVSETIELDVIPYEKLIQNDLDTLQTLDRALHEKGIVGVRGVPGYRAKYEQFINAARRFSALP